jgi:hypothetical protein
LNDSSDKGAVVQLSWRLVRVMQLAAGDGSTATGEGVKRAATEGSRAPRGRARPSAAGGVGGARQEQEVGCGAAAGVGQQCGTAPPLPLVKSREYRNYGVP